MRRTACTIGLLVWIADPTGANETLQQIKDNCSREWGLDYAMMEHCRSRQIEAAREFVTIRDGLADADPRMMLLANCYAEWTKRRGSNWPMVMHCYRRQTKALEQMDGD